LCTYIVCVWDGMDVWMNGCTKRVDNLRRSLDTYFGGDRG